MFERLGSLVFRLRYLIVLGWIVGAIVALLFAPSLANQGSTDESSFLPPQTEAVLARQALERGFPSEVSAGAATVSFTRDSGLSDADRSYIGRFAAWITSAQAPAALRDVVASVDTAETRPALASMLRSSDGKLELVNVNLTVASVAGGSADAVDALRSHLAATAPSGLEAHVTGQTGISVDYLKAIVQGTDSTTLVTVALVVIILLLIYRAPLAALVPLITIGAAFLVSRGTLGTLAAAGWKLSSLLDTFVVVLVFGVGTDYTIFLISRFREEVSKGDWHAASVATVRRIGAVISASAATVIVGLGSMAFGQFGMIQTMGPALAVTILVTLIAGLTLAPALLGIFGHWLFWPRHLHDESQVDAGSLFARLATQVSRHPGIVTVFLLVVVAAPVAALSGARTNFDVLAELPKGSDARAGFDQVAQHMGRGRIMPSIAVIDAGTGTDLMAPASLAKLASATKTLARLPGVQSATSVIAPTGDGSVPEGFVPSKQLATMAAGFGGSGSGGGAADPAALLDPKVVAGLASAASYLDALAPAYPTVASGPGFAQAQADLEAAPVLIDRLRTSARVSTQLHGLSAALAGQAVSAGTTPGPQALQALAGYLQTVGAYLRELDAAYPDAAQLPGVGRAQADLLAMAQGQGAGRLPAATLADLTAALEELATDFDARPDAVLFPKSLPASSEATALQAQISATFGRLPEDLSALSATFAARPDDTFIPTTLGGDAGAEVTQAVTAFVSKDDTTTRLYVTTTGDPYSTAAFDTVRRAREAFDPLASQFGTQAHAYVGGSTADMADLETTLGNDFRRVAVITVLGVLLVLVLLLRALVAPLYLVLTVLLSFLSALGLTSWFFENVMGQPGINYYLPLIVFVLLVALGSDYNIFLISRVREEAERLPIRDAIRVASGRTGAVITSAGIILAGTFGSMASAQLTVLFQVGVAVAAGVLLDTFVVRSILVPAITTLAGDRAWWPSRTRRAIVEGGDTVGGVAADGPAGKVPRGPTPAGA